MPLPRFRLRTLMIAVAVVGVLLAVKAEIEWLDRIAMGHRSRAALLALEGQFCRTNATVLRQLKEQGKIPSEGTTVALAKLNELAPWMRLDSAVYDRRSEHYAAMSRKYERAARYPWLSVPPDPPEPK